MKLLPVKENLEDNKEFTDNPKCQDSIGMSVDFFKKIGYNPPWIGYYVEVDGELVGAAAFKGKPVNSKVEIAYMTFPEDQNKGIGTQIAAILVKLALETDSTVRVTALTLPQENYSTKILRKNNFVHIGKAIDEDEGEVWEWEYDPTPL